MSGNRQMKQNGKLPAGSNAAADEKDKRWMLACFQILFGLVVWETGKLVGMFAEELFLGPHLTEDALHYGMQSFFGQAGAVLFLLIFQRRWIVEKVRSGVQRFRQTKEERKKQMMLMASLVPAALGLNFLLWGSGFAASSEGFAQTAAAQASVPVWLGLLLYMFAAPAAEELMFRGVMYGRLREMITPKRAAIGSAVFFGLYHGNLIQAVYGICMALLLCVVYERIGGLLSAICGHALANLFVYVIIDVWAPGFLMNGAGAMIGCGVICLAAAAGLIVRSV